MNDGPCSTQRNKIPQCCALGPCSDAGDSHYEAGVMTRMRQDDSSRQESCRECTAGEQIAGRTVREPNGVNMKERRPCIPRSEAYIPGRPPEQYEGLAGERRRCRKMHPKPCRRRKKREGADGKGEDGEGQDEYREGEWEDSDEDHMKNEGWEDSLMENEEKGEGRKRPCRKKKRRKPRKAPCRSANMVRAGDKHPLFPALPMPPPQREPPVQNFPPAYDPEKGRGSPCRQRRKPCRKRGTSSSSCTDSSSVD